MTILAQATFAVSVPKYDIKKLRAFIVLFSSICLGAVLLLAQGKSKSAYVMVSPVNLQTFQRDWTSNTANIPIIVDAAGYGDTFSLQVKWKDNAWVPVQFTRVTQACASATIKKFSTANITAKCYRYTGVLPNRPVGQADLFTRLGAEPPGSVQASVQTTTRFVGVGDVILLAGQSNSVGVANNFQQYQSTVYVAAMFSRMGQWVQLDDKILTDQRPIATNAPIKGSPWPILGALITQYTGAPVAFIPTGIGSQPISQWSANGSLYKFMVQQARLSGTQPAIILWHQGESDALTKMPTSTYQNALNDLVQRTYNDLHIRMMIANLEILSRPGITEADVANIRQAIENEWAQNPLVYQGPSLTDIPLVAQPHFTTDGEVQQLAQHWFDRLVAVGLPHS